MEHSRNRPALTNALFPLIARYPADDFYERPSLRESRTRYDDSVPSERQVQCVWFDAAWRPDELRTDRGEPVAVADPGRWNLEAGPDFLDADLRVGSERRVLRGDIEVHVRPSDWFRHGHDGNPAYSRVAAHVTYGERGTRDARFPSGMLHIPLRKALAQNPSFCFDAIDLAAYPYAVAAAARPCALRLRDGDPDAVRALLQGAGQRRLRIKSERMALEIRRLGAEQALYAEVMTGLGYKHNKGPFRELAERVSYEDLRCEAGGDTRRAYALLLGVAGLIPERLSPFADAESRRFARRLWDFWWKRQSAWSDRVMARGAWRLSGLRPQNHPRRRLAAAAALFGGSASLATDLAAQTGDPAASASDAARSIVHDLQKRSRMTFWSHRLSFAGPAAAKPTALIGEPRAADIFINTLFPYLVARGAWTLALPAVWPRGEDNARVRRVAATLFGRDRNPALCRCALIRQGLLQIESDYCSYRDDAPCRPARICCTGSTAALPS